MEEVAGSVRGRARLRRAQRVRKRADFVRIQDGGLKVSTRHLLFLLGPGAPGAPARLGVVASRKVGNAVARNRAKRLVRELFRTNPFPPGVDVVVVVRAGTHELGLAELAAELRGASPALARRSTEAAGLRRDGRGPRLRS